MDATLRASSVLRSASGWSVPSTESKSGSRPHDSSNRSWMLGSEMLKASSGAWQLAQARLFVPSDWKNGFSRSSSSSPDVE